MSEGRARPAWLGYIPGIIAALWVVYGFGGALWRNLPTLNALGTFLLGAVFVGVVAFFISGLWPIGVHGQIPTEEIRNYPKFLRGPEPSDPRLRALWRSLRRSLA